MRARQTSLSELPTPPPVQQHAAPTIEAPVVQHPVAPEVPQYPQPPAVQEAPTQPLYREGPLPDRAPRQPAIPHPQVTHHAAPAPPVIEYAREAPTVAAAAPTANPYGNSILHQIDLSETDSFMQFPDQAVEVNVEITSAEIKTAASSQNPMIVLGLRTLAPARWANVKLTDRVVLTETMYWKYMSLVRCCEGPDNQPLLKITPEGKKVFGGKDVTDFVGNIVSCRVKGGVSDRGNPMNAIQGGYSMPHEFGPEAPIAHGNGPHPVPVLEEPKSW